MFDKLQQLKELKKMRDEAMTIQKTLDAETIEVEKHGVRIKMTLAQRVVSVESNVIVLSPEFSVKPPVEV